MTEWAKDVNKCLGTIMRMPTPLLHLFREFLDLEIAIRDIVLPDETSGTKETPQAIDS